MAKYYVGELDNQQWQHVLSRALASADRFQVMTPDGAGPLSYGRTLFGSLPGVTVTSSDRMRDAIVISGELTNPIRDLFSSTQTSINEYDDDADTRLWDYQLLRGEVEILSIGDHSDLILEATDQDLAEWQSAGLSCSEWDQID